MNHVLRIRTVRVHRLAIPMRLRFEHAAASRAVADPVVVELLAEAPFADHVGYGETLARPYVTGENADTVVEDMVEAFIPELLELRAGSFAEVVEFADALPDFRDGRLVNAVRAAVELALLDLGGRCFQRPAVDACRWLDLPGFARPGCVHQASYSGMVVGSKPLKRRWLLRAQRCYGLRDFKLKVAVPGWEVALRDVARLLRRDLAAGKATLRADANGAWTLDEALAAVPLMEECGVEALEQPMSRADDALLPKLAAATQMALIADESLRTREEARGLIEAGVGVLNVRVAKNGGLLPSWRIAAEALSAGRDVQLGCLVGETGLLTAAGCAFLSACPRVRYVEGAFGRWLLRDDVTKSSIQFGRYGRVTPPQGVGLGVDVDPEALKRLAAGPVIETQL